MKENKLLIEIKCFKKIFGKAKNSCTLHDSHTRLLELLQTYKLKSCTKLMYKNIYEIKKQKARVRFGFKNCFCITKLQINL